LQSWTGKYDLFDLLKENGEKENTTSELTPIEYYKTEAEVPQEEKGGNIAGGYPIILSVEGLLAIGPKEKKNGEEESGKEQVRQKMWANEETEYYFGGEGSMNRGIELKWYDVTREFAKE